MGVEWEQNAQSQIDGLVQGTGTQGKRHRGQHRKSNHGLVVPLVHGTRSVGIDHVRRGGELPLTCGSQKIVEKERITGV